MSLLKEIGRRKVFRVAAVYAVVAWLLVQIVSTIEEPLSLPASFDTVVIVLLAIGFPIALILSWAFDLTPDGIQATKPATEAPSARPAAGAVTMLIQALILLAVGFLVVDQYLLDSAARSSEPASSTTTALVNRFAHTITANQPVENSRWNVFAFSANGRRFAYLTDYGIYVRDLDALESRFVVGSENVFSGPFLSPDGRYLAYHSTRGDLVRLAIDESAPSTIVPGITPLSSAGWLDDDTILYANGRGLFRVRADGGDPETLIPRNDENFLANSRLQLLPDGDSVLLSRKPRLADWDDAEILLHTLSTGEQTVLLTGGSDARYVEATGHLVYATGESLYGVAFDPETRAILGTPHELVSGLTRALATNAANYDIARDGTLAYLSRVGKTLRTLVWVDRDGVEHAIEMEPGNFWYAQLSPDDSMVALNGWDESLTRRVWIHDLERATTRQLTFGPAEANPPIWAPNGRLAYGLRDVVWQRADNAGVAEVLKSNRADAGPSGTVPSAFTPDGTTLITMNTDPPRYTWASPVGDPEAPATRILAVPGSAYNATVSPDGKWLAYQSDESGELQVYVRAWPDVDGGGLWRISNDGGLQPLWSPNRQRPELFYLEPSAGNPGFFRVMAVAVDADLDDTFAHDPPVPLFERRIRTFFSMFRGPYSVTRDGKRFLMIEEAPPEDTVTGTSEVVIVQNFFEELRRLVPRD